MIDALQIYEEFAESLGDASARLMVKSLTSIYEDLKNSVIKAELSDLKAIVRDIVDTQNRTGQRLEELAEAQKRTEQRLAELIEAHRDAEKRLTRLENTVAELIEAHRDAEKRLTRLENTVAELIEAQKKTEESLNKLIKRVDDIEEQLGGISYAVGYGLEDRMYPHISRYVKKVYGIEPEELRLRRHLIYEDGRYDEINIFVRGKRDGRDCLAVGECKSQPGKKDIDRFMRVVERVKRYYGAEVYPFIIGYIFQPSIEGYIRENYRDLKYHMTYEIEYDQYLVEVSQ